MYVIIQHYYSSFLSSFWRRDVKFVVTGDSPLTVSSLINEFLGEETLDLHIVKEVLNADSEDMCQWQWINGGDMGSLGSRCPNLDKLTVESLTIRKPWPLSAARPWASLQELALFNVRLRSDTFQDADMHFTFPELRTFRMNWCNSSLVRAKPDLNTD